MEHLHSKELIRHGDLAMSWARLGAGNCILNDILISSKKGLPLDQCVVSIRITILKASSIRTKFF